MKQFTNSIIIVSICFLSITICLSLLLLNLNQHKVVVSDKPMPQFICGNVSSNLSANAMEGKNLFNANCAACHKLDKTATGRALRNLRNKYELPYENYWFDYLTKEDSLLNIRNKLTLNIDAKYEENLIHKFKLTKTDIENILNYTN